MGPDRKPLKLAGLLLLLLVAGVLFFWKGKPAVQPSDLVGKWHSSRITTPIYLHENGEWEIKNDEGGILQYGVWRLDDKTLIWTVRLGSKLHHDANRVLSVGPNEFRIRENSGSVTTFTRLGQ